MEKSDSFLTLVEAAGYLRIHPRTAIKLIMDGEIPAVRIGGQWRVPNQQLQEYLYAHSNVAYRALLDQGEVDA